MRRRTALAIAVILVVSGCGPAPVSLPPSPIGPGWLVGGIVGQLECDGLVAPLGAGSDPGSIAGAAMAPSLEQSVNAFIADEAAIYAFLPLGGWAIGRRDAHFAVVTHDVGGRTKAAALFSDGNDSDPPGPWALWTVAACDPFEFAPNVEISYGLRVWSAEGGRVATSIVLDMIPACGASELLKIEGRVFLRAPSERAGVDPAGYHENATLPDDAHATPYSSDARNLWISPDGLFAFVGSNGDLERWPRIEGDDFSVIDCN